MRTAAVLPVKSFGRAKQRLGDAVGQPDRAELAAGMVGDVLAALAAVPELDDVVVVTAEPRAAAAAREAGAHVIGDPVEAGQSAAAALRRGRGGAPRRRRGPCSCRATARRSTPAEVSALLGGYPGAGVVIVPDRHGSGTNALLLTPPGAIAPSFGPGSFARHAAGGAAAGARVRVAHAPSLELDVDTPGDLAALQRALMRLPEAAPRTRALLDRMAPRSALA